MLLANDLKSMPPRRRPEGEHAAGNPCLTLGSSGATLVNNDQAEIERFVLSVSRAAKQGVAG